MSDNGKQRVLDDIDNYQDSVFAIIGFANFYRFDDATKTMRPDVLVFQGRRLTPSSAKAVNSDGNPVEFVTPDVGVLLPTNTGVLAEVVNELHEKFSFHQLHTQTSDRQPKIPRTVWVRRAFDRLVKAGEAEWLDRAKGTLRAKFARHDDVLAHFVELCAADQEATGQLPLFQDTR